MKEGYVHIEIAPYPKTGWQKFKQVVKRSLGLELLKGLWVVFKVMAKDPSHTTIYPAERLPLSPRYRAIHKLLRLAESGSERCIGCGLCEKICPAHCIRMDTGLDEDGRKKVFDYTINFGRCIYCGLCAEVCPELAIVHGDRFENASEQRAHFSIKNDMLSQKEAIKLQKEFLGFGAVSPNADANLKKTPLAY
ncbi:MAG: NADH-quinone oxidoreductase subunit NuoI [Helicobacteraceae bacterium]|jgi:NADH-quinone oxidoreductase subunit I|nr:NADH-quinone oxidoreductase subunit NuoI [Helicobacteraceae bacterium]